MMLLPDLGEWKRNQCPPADEPNERKAEDVAFPARSL